MTEYLKDLLDKTKEENRKNQILRVLDFEIHRSIIKHSIMTYVYNATPLTMADYIRDVCIKIEKDDKTLYKSPLADKYLEYSDFMFLAKIVKQVVSKEFPRVSLLSSYLSNIAEIMNSLELPIPWLVPSGVKITQSYRQTKQLILKPFSYSTKSVTLQVIVGDGVLNKRKQKIALMPNLIHSLDASSLALLFQKYHDRDGSQNSIYTIHDCFAVTANNVENLIDTLKDVYIQIYSDNKYLEEFDRSIRECIKIHYNDVQFIDNKLIIEDNIYSFPSINVVSGKDLQLYPNIKNSCYIIS